MQRRSFIRAASIGLAGVGVGAIAAPANAETEIADSDAVRQLATILCISETEASALWSDKGLREYLPVSISTQVNASWGTGEDINSTQVRSGGEHTSLSGGSDSVEPFAGRNFILSTGHSFKNLFGSVLFSATLSKTTRIGGSYATKVRTNMNYSTSSLGLATWVPKGVQGGRSIDERRGTSHYSERVALWFGSGGRFLDANVSLIVGALVRNNGTYTTTKKTEKPPWV